MKIIHSLKHIQVPVIKIQLLLGGQLNLMHTCLGTMKSTYVFVMLPPSALHLTFAVAVIF